MSAPSTPQGRDAAFNDPAMRGLAGGPTKPLQASHPAGLYLLFTTEMWERFSYYGMKAFLVLYMTAAVTTGGLGWDKAKANSLYGWYTGLVYLTPILGGYFADRFLGTANSMLLGGSIIAVGHFSLAFETLPSFYFGLLCIIVGTGFFKPCVSVMVGQLYPEREGKPDPRKDAAFTIFYMGINLGAFLGPIICGGLRVGQRKGEVFGWSWAFGAAGVGMVLSLICFVIGKPFLLKGVGGRPTRDQRAKAAADAGPLTRQDIDGIIAIFIMAFFTIFFWSAFEQAGSSMNLFAEERTDRALTAETARSVWRWGTEEGYPLPSYMFALIGAAVSALWLIAEFKIKALVASKPVALVLRILGLAVGPALLCFGLGKQLGFVKEAFFPDDFLTRAEAPADWFQSINPFFILTLAPIFASIWVRLGKLGKEPSTPLKFALGLLFLGLGFIFMVEGGRQSDAGGAGTITKVSWFYLSAAFCIHTVGELCLSPVGLSMVNKLAPAKFVSLLMGVWFLSNFVANKFAAFIAGQEDWIATHSVNIGVTTLSGRALFYSIFVGGPIAAGILLLILNPFLRRFMHNRA